MEVRGVLNINNLPKNKSGTSDNNSREMLARLTGCFIIPDNALNNKNIQNPDVALINNDFSKFIKTDFGYFRLTGCIVNKFLCVAHRLN